MIFTVKSIVYSILFFTSYNFRFLLLFFSSTMYLAFFFLLLEIGLFSHSSVLVVVVVKNVHAFALFSGVQRHATAAMTATTILP